MIPNPTYLPAGYVVATQMPIDCKVYFRTISEMQDLGNDSHKAFMYYHGMLAFCLETKEFYLWDESLRFSEKILENDFIYPPNHNSFGVDYSNKSFNFIPQRLYGQGYIRYLYGELNQTGSDEISMIIKSTNFEENLIGAFQFINLGDGTFSIINSLFGNKENFHVITGDSYDDDNTYIIQSTNDNFGVIKIASKNINGTPQNGIIVRVPITIYFFGNNG